MVNDGFIGIHDTFNCVTCESTKITCWEYSIGTKYYRRKYYCDDCHRYFMIKCQIYGMNREEIKQAVPKLRDVIKEIGKGKKK